MTDARKPLDIDAVRCFILIADLCSFTRAAEVLDTSQAAISLKLKRLETRLGYRLLERTPRYVQLTEKGAGFIERARELLLAYERAVSEPTAVLPRRLTLGISDHVAGADLPVLLGRLGSFDPLLQIEVRIASSRDLVTAFDAGELEAVVVRREGARTDGEVLVTEYFGWFASPSWQQRPGEPLRLATLAAPCGVRGVAIKALDAAGVPWVEVFIGGGVLAVAAAVTAGLGVAALAQRVAPPGAVDVGERLGLPPMPASDIVLYSRATEPRTREMLRALGAAFRSHL
ncbi:LysR family transcriptional regulator [Pseudomonas sp. NA-150]|uniref:LysR family transcriptional regulator n=1 Tax=Pseudomonas sp. NA-150 TaxID=3367525 RepID=UPI0037C84F0E